MKLTVGFSPCPNDTFMFDALVHSRMDMQGIEIEPVMVDVEELNKMAFREELDVSKLSYHAAAYLLDKYAILESGSALGHACGPLLISKNDMTDRDLQQKKIAIPGKYTTANLLLSLAYPRAQNKEELLFSDIEEAVLDERVYAGLIIHENRFTYQQKGLKKICDLGEYWEQRSGFPIPLGAIAIKRSLPYEVKRKFAYLLQKSVEAAFSAPQISMPFVRAHAQEMDDQVMKAHIHLYVNDYSKKLGKQGRDAVRHLYKEAMKVNAIPKIDLSTLFLGND